MGISHKDHGIFFSQRVLTGCISYPCAAGSLLLFSTHTGNISCSEPSMKRLQNRTQMGTPNDEFVLSSNFWFRGPSDQSSDGPPHSAPVSAAGTDFPSNFLSESFPIVTPYCVPTALCFPCQSQSNFPRLTGPSHDDKRIGIWALHIQHLLFIHHAFILPLHTLLTYLLV